MKSRCVQLFNHPEMCMLTFMACQNTHEGGWLQIGDDSLSSIMYGKLELYLMSCEYFFL